MSNVIIAVKKFLQNKNVVTLIGVILIVVILYLLYSYQIQAQVQPVSIPVAAETIQPGTEITTDMVRYITVPQAAISENVIRNQNGVIGMYTNFNTEVPAGSMFYTDVLVAKDSLPGSVFTQVHEGDVVYSLDVTTRSTYGNSMLPNTFIDLYMKAEDEDGQIMIGKLIEDLEVLAVKDASGKNVFENSSDSRSPAFMIFGVSPEIHILLRKCEYMNEQSVEVIPVPHGSEPTLDGTEAKVSSTYLKEFINSQTVTLPDEDSSTTTNTDNTKKTDSKTTNK